MSIWFVLPARRDPADSTIPVWRAAGYRVAIVREIGLAEIDCDLYLPCREYPGWARSVNALIAAVMMRDQGAEWFVLGGDDTQPDQNHTPEEIGNGCLLHFSPLTGIELRQHGTYGVMQPTGDRRADSQGVIIERVAGSPWIGREFARRMYGGAGPLWNGWFHNFADEELQDVSLKQGVFWQRPDIIHEHRHWAYKRGSREDCPEWAERIHTPQRWGKDKALFDRRKVAGFPGHEPLEE